MQIEHIGNSTLYCADWREVLPDLEGVDAVVTDPPYGIGYKPQKHNSKKSLAKRNFSPKDQICGDSGKLDFDASPIYQLYASLPQIWWGANFYADSLPRSRGWLAWYKHRGIGKNSYSSFEAAWTSLDMPSQLLDFLWAGMCRDGKENGLSSVHPTQKPIDVMLWSLSFLPAGVKNILDPFAGSGTTGIAAIKTGRRFLGVEKEQRHFDSACLRIERAQQSMSLLQLADKRSEQCLLSL